MEPLSERMPDEVLEEETTSFEKKMGLLGFLLTVVVPILFFLYMIFSK